MRRPSRADVAEKAKSLGVPLAIEFRGRVWRWTVHGVFAAERLEPS